ncbi:MAG: DUF2141 domain-containing protein [Alphaproteobacteria bacterium]|nr:DUF2141 domain-containing protein [Alphaproteobacteria bacterium]
MLWITAALAADLVVDVRGLDSDAGQVFCALYDSADGWLTEAGVEQAVSATPAGLAATCRFPSMPAGRYAVSVLHDANANGAMDWTALGLPKESWGVSRDAPAVLGRPSFASSAFQHDGSRQVIHVR